MYCKKYSPVFFLILILRAMRGTLLNETFWSLASMGHLHDGSSICPLWVRVPNGLRELVLLGLDTCDIICSRRKDTNGRQATFSRCRQEVVVGTKLRAASRSRRDIPNADHMFVRHVT